MGISLRTALIIQGNDNITTSVGGPNDDGKYTGWVMGPRAHERWDPLLDTGPAYDTEEEAKAAVDGIVAEVEDLDLDDHRAKLLALMP